MDKRVLFAQLFLYILGFFLLAIRPCLAASTSSVTGKAKVINTGNSYLDFTSTYSSNVTVNNTTGNFSGYAWLEDVGWCDFGTTDNPNGPVTVNLSTGAVTGKAYCVNTGAYIDFTSTYSSNVTVSFASGAFSGYGWSQDVGWLDFGDTGVTLADAGPAVTGLSAWTDSTHNTGISQNVSQKDGEVSFTWTDLRLQTGDYFYWEYNTDSGNTITGDEMYVTTAYKDNILLKEGTSYFHVRPRVGSTGAWGTELTFKIIYDATDNLSRLGATLIFPEDGSYTRDLRPVFTFKKGVNTLSGIDHYELVIDDGWGGSFAYENIPTQPTLTGNKNSTPDDFVSDKLKVIYQNWHDDREDNDYLLVETLETAKILKEGARKWTVKAVDLAGNQRQASRSLYVDLTAPKVVLQKIGAMAVDPAVKTWSYQGSRPKLTLNLNDPMNGEVVADDNKAKTASGPKILEIKIQKQNFWGDWVDYLITTENISDGSGKENYAFIFQPSLDLSAGLYRLEFVFEDNAGNHSEALSVNLRVEGSLITEKQIEKTVEKKETELGRPLSPAEKEEVVEQLHSGGPVSQKENLVSKFLAGLWRGTKGVVKGAWWRSVAAGKFLAGAVAKGWRTGTGAVSLAFRKTAETILGFNLYGYLVGKVADFGRQLAYATATSRELMASRTQPLFRKLQITAGFLASVWFDKEPTKIANVRIEEAGADYALIVWETNHYATSKVNWGESYDYGQSLESGERTKLHKMKITGLTPGKTYYYEVMSQNKNYVFDARHEFRTTDK